MMLLSLRGYRHLNGIPVNGFLDGHLNGIPVNGFPDGHLNGIPVDGFPEACGRLCKEWSKPGVLPRCHAPLYQKCNAETLSATS